MRRRWPCMSGWASSACATWRSGRWRRIPGASTVEPRALDVDAAHAWIAGHRAGREPWQRADASIVRMRERGTPLVGMAVQRSGQIAGAAICRPDAATVRVLQIAAVDRAAARDLILAAAGELTLRLANVPSDDLLSGCCAGWARELTAAQHEMRLQVALSGHARPAQPLSGVARASWAATGMAAMNAL